MGKSNKFLTARVPTAGELTRLRKVKKKSAEQVKALRQRQVLQDDITKNQRELGRLKKQQSKIGKIVRRVDTEWRATAKQRKSIGKELGKAYRKLEKLE